jgi:hypothetical protein
MGLDEPQPLVDAARHLREQVGRVQVAQLVGGRDGLPRRLAATLVESGQRPRRYLTP